MLIQHKKIVYRAESMVEGEIQSFQAELFCEESKTTEVKNFTLQCHPSTFLDIKKAIEKNFSIPVCVQTLFHQSCKVADLDNPLSSYVRSGDTFTVCYPAKGDCRKVIEVIEWLKRLVDAISHRLQYRREGTVHPAMISSEYQTLLSVEYAQTSRDLCLNLIYPWTDRTKYVNKLHFDSLGGVELVIRVYKYLVSARLDNIIMFKSHYLETICGLFVANFTQTFSLRRRIIEHGGLDLSIQTFLWSQVISNSTTDATEVSLYAICNLSELPECQLKLAQRSDIIDQALQVAKSPLFTFKTALVSTSYLLCLSQCSEAHPYLLQPNLMGELIHVCEIRRAESLVHFIGHATIALESYASIFMAQMIIRSSQYLLLFPESLLRKIHALMQSVCITNPRDIRAYEIQEELVWGTFLPYVQYLYDPIDTPILTEDEQLSCLIAKLRDLSVKVLLHALHNALGRESHVKILIEEGLMDYLVALMWHVSDSSRVMLKDCLKDISKLIVIRPPSLCSLAKAKLARDSVGLKKVMDMTSVSDLLSF